VSEIQRLTGANRSTIKVKLRDLIEMKKIQSFGKGRGVTYAVAKLTLKNLISFIK
jgi:predicted transcriptional regulator